jgi:hypothetical protein
MTEARLSKNPLRDGTTQEACREACEMFDHFYEAVMEEVEERADCEQVDAALTWHIGRNLGLIKKKAQPALSDTAGKDSAQVDK